MNWQDIQTGDVVIVSDWRGSDPDDRTNGIVCRKDTHHPDSTNTIMFIAEVLWSSGRKSWIDADRLSVVAR